MIGLMIYLAGRNTSRRSSCNSGRPYVSPTNYWNFTLKPMAQITQDCDAQEIRNLYYRMQEGWSKGDISDLEADFTAEAFASYTNQLKAKNDRGEHAHCTVHSVVVDKMGWNESATDWKLAVRLYATITDWDTDDRGLIISGSDTARKHMVYAWELRKAKCIGANVKRCPNCGAELKMNAGATCVHCQTHLTAAANRWTLHSIKGISQKTMG